MLICLEVPRSEAGVLRNTRLFRYEGRIPYAYGKESAEVYSAVVRETKHGSVYTIREADISKYLVNTPLRPGKGVDAEFYLAEFGGECVGITGISRNLWRPYSLCILEWFAVYGKKRGVGGKLFGASEYIARKSGFTGMMIETTYRITIARVLYRTRGYRLVLRIRDFYGRGYPYLAFVKKL